jgi:hypothetical protein
MSDPKPLNPESLSESERDKLLLNMAESLVTLCKAIQDLSNTIEFLLSMITFNGPVGRA